MIETIANLRERGVRKPPDIESNPLVYLDAQKDLWNWMKKCNLDFNGAAKALKCSHQSVRAYLTIPTSKHYRKLPRKRAEIIKTYDGGQNNG